jgi:hypothetical protein
MQLLQLAANSPAAARDVLLKRVNTTEPLKQQFPADGLIRLYEPNSFGRNMAERFIHKQFARYYGANVTDFLPFLLTIESAGGIRGGLGIRPADARPLFLEQYLLNSIEDEAEKIHGLTVRRHALVEIGNLACARRGLSQLMFITLTAYLQRMGIDWVACNATCLVQNNFARLGFEYHPLCVADKNLLQGGFSQWGSYYDSRSEVTLINVHQAYRCLTSNPFSLVRLQAIESMSNSLPDLNLLD